MVLAEATREVGGRVARESRLPGLHAWNRVIEYREQQLRRMPNVEIYLQSRIDTEDATGQDFDHVVVATGARWRRDGVGRWNTMPIPDDGSAQLLTPDDIMAGVLPHGRRVVVFDDDHYYLGGVIAELLSAEGYQVRMVTPAAHISAWTANTLELVRIRQRVMAAGVSVGTGRPLTRITGGSATTSCVFTGAEERVGADTAVLVTARLPNEELCHHIVAAQAAHAVPAGSGQVTVTAIGDAKGLAEPARLV